MNRAVLTIVFLGLGCSVFSQTGEWRQTYFRDGQVVERQRVSIDAAGVTTVRVYSGADRLIRETVLGPGLVPLGGKTYGPDGTLAVSIAVSDDQTVSAVTPRGSRTQKKEGPFFLSDESLYVVFSNWVLDGSLSKERIVRIYDPFSGNFTDMRLVRAAAESVTVGGRSVPAVRIEMSLADAVVRFLFWPHVYSYWFAADDARFLAYEGLDRDGKKERVERE